MSNILVEQFGLVKGMNKAIELTDRKLSKRKTIKAQEYEAGLKKTIAVAKYSLGLVEAVQAQTSVFQGMVSDVLNQRFDNIRADLEQWIASAEMRLPVRQEASGKDASDFLVVGMERSRSAMIQYEALLKVYEGGLEALGNNPFKTVAAITALLKWLRDVAMKALKVGLWVAGGVAGVLGLSYLMRKDD